MSTWNLDIPVASSPEARPESASASSPGPRGDLLAYASSPSISTSLWRDSEYHAFVAMARRLGVRPLDLLVVLAAESGLKPWAIARVNGEPYALGLNQITPPAARAIKLSEEQWAEIPELSVLEQLPIVERSLAASFRFGVTAPRDAGEIYQANFAPATLKKGTHDSLVLYASPSGGYKGNQPLDEENKGSITVGDMRRRLRKVSGYTPFRDHLSRMRALGLVGATEGPVIQGPNETPWGWILTGVGTVAGALGLWWWSQKQPETTSRRMR